MSRTLQKKKFPIWKNWIFSILVALLVAGL